MNPAVNYGAGDWPYSIVIGDLNVDEKPDIVVANYRGDNVSVLLGNGDGSFQSAVNYGTGSRPLSVAIGDLNGDGDLDLVTASDADTSQTLSYAITGGNTNSAFAINSSTGQITVNDQNELRRSVKQLFRDTELVLAQAFAPTEFDWRIGLVGGEPLYVCQYAMAPGHWQIVNHKAARKQAVTGEHTTIAVDDAPPGLFLDRGWIL